MFVGWEMTYFRVVVYVIKFYSILNQATNNKLFRGKRCVVSSYLNIISLNLQIYDAMLLGLFIATFVHL